MWTRREILGRSAPLAGLAATTWFFWGHRPLSLLPGTTPLALPAPAFRTLVAACSAALEDEAAGLVVATDIDRFLAGEGRDQAADLHLALRILEHGTGPWWDRRRFSLRSPAEQSTALYAWLGSGWGVRRQIAVALVKSARFTWFAREETWGELGYDGPWVGRGP